MSQPVPNPDASTTNGPSGTPAATVKGHSPFAASLSQERPRKPVSWKRNLAVMWLAQCVSAMSFSVAFPFFPLFIQDMGIEDPGRAALWAGISGSAMGVTMIFCGPIWGMMGDRYGRKKNVLRAMVGGATLMALTGLSTNVYQLTAYRFATGIVSGTFATAMALVASTSPKERMAFSMGTLQSAMFLGSTLGPTVGGFLADAFGFRTVFFVSGAGIATAGVMVLIFAREDFQKPADAGPLFRHEAFTGILRLVASRELAPIQGTIFVVNITPALMFVVLPLLIVTLAPESGASATGIAFGILGITAAMASYVTGWLSLHVRLSRILAVACIGAALFYLPFIIVDTVALVYLFLTIAGVFQGALIASTAGLIGKALPPEKQGTGFGVLQSVTAAGFSFGPLVGGTIATLTGLRSVFLAQSIGFLIAAVLAVRLLSGMEAQWRQPSSDEESGVSTKPVGKVGGV